MSPMTRGLVAKLEDFVTKHDIPLVQFEKGQRKDAVMAEHLRHFGRDEGIVLSARRRRTPRCSAPSGVAARRRVGRTHGSCGVARW
jgi:hypothetical protein